MPSLTKEEQERLIGPTMGTCPSCRLKVIRQYCRECDEFWFKCNCIQYIGEGDVFDDFNS